MTIRGLLAAVVIPFFVLTSLVVWKYFDVVYYRSLKSIETSYVHNQVTVIKKLINTTTRRYSMLATDWGAWDDSYQFMSDRNSHFISSNMDPSALYTTDSDTLLFMNKNRQVYYLLTRPQLKTDMNGIAEKIKVNGLSGNSGSFFIQSPYSDKIFFVSYSKVTDSEMTKPYRGYFLVMLTMDRYLKNTFSDSGLDISSVSARTINGIYGTTIKSASSIQDNDILITVQLPMSNAHTSMDIKFTMKRSVFSFVNGMIDKTVIAVMIIFIVASSLMTAIMYFALLRRIGHLTEDFSRLENSPDFGMRLPVKGVRELRTLAFTANKALDDITSLNKKLTMMTNVDGLTGINNRRYFDDMFDKEFREAVRFGRPLAVLMLDIDNFKIFNDTYGHIAGDECLKSVARIIADSLKRPSDLAARYGGEEFTVILPHTDDDGAMTVAERIRSAVHSAAISSGTCRNAQVSISIGAYSCIPSDLSQSLEIIAYADKALYQAKCGKNRAVLYRND